MNRRWLAAAAATTVAIILMAGCADDSAHLGSAEFEPTPFDTAAAKAEEATKAAEEAARQVEPAPAAEAPTVEQVVEYEPPFPDRTELFEPRKQAARAARLSSGDSAESVVLMGFAKLDEPQVLLAINGEVKPLRSGEEASGVQVISIDPPRAVLQRGRSRWTASIE